MSHEQLPTDRRAVVTCGLPYANGNLHVGHLRTYVDGDLYSRALRRIGQQTAFVCGSDMHGTPVAVNAAEQGVDPEAFALEWHEQYRDRFPEFNIAFDNYGHTHEETNVDLTQEFVRTWIDREYVLEQEIEVAWDAELDEPLPDRYVEGTCPYCGARARGDECDEGCQRHLEPGEIEDPRSVRTGNPAEYRTREHKFLRLTDFQEYLQGFIDRLEGTDNARNQPREWIEGELQELCLTRDMDWGVDYPAADREDLVLYVWVDAPIEYIASTKQHSERVGAEEYDWEAAWKPGGETRHGLAFEDSWQAESGELIHIIGRDIIQQHCVFWPAMLRGAGYSEPRAVLATGFVNIDGDALSTSRNRAVWAEEYLDADFHPDLFRYYITTGSGLSNDVDFSWDRFAERVNGELVGNLGNFCYRALLFADRNYDGTPDTAVSDEIRGQIADAVETFETAVREYDVRTLGQVAVDLADVGNEYIQRNEPWNLVGDDPDQAAQVIRDCVQLTRACAVLMQPVMPEKAQTLWGQLGEDGQVSGTSLDDALEPPADEFGDPAELFEQVEDDQIERLNEDLRERVADAGDSEDSEGEAGADPAEVDANGGERTDSADVDAGESDSDDMAGDDSADEDGETALDPVETDRIGFEQFQDLDMRVGEILVADPIEGADDLVRLEVDIGVDRRQVVAGIKQLHDTDTLPGTRVVLLANMERAELFGHESNGMVLAAGEEADLLTTHEDAPLGSRIR
jgi:methionyl-tRNA synthetase